MASSIESYLEQILNAVYGEQVRNAIHDSIEQCYTDVSTAETAADSAASNATNATLRLNALLGDVSSYLSDNVTVAGVIQITQSIAEDAATAAEQAYENSALAEQKATLAEQKATLAEQKAGLAESAATTAYDASEIATNAATGVQDAILAANTATTRATNAAVSATAQADAANSAAQRTADAITAASIATASATEATSAANDAADHAESVVSNIEDLTQNIQVLSTNAETAINSLTDLLSRANSAIVSTESAISNAEIAASMAANNAQDAIDAATSADQKASRAETAAENASSAAFNATTAASSAFSASERATAIAVALEDLTASASSISYTREASAEIDNYGTHKNITFYIPRGEPGTSFKILGNAYESVSELSEAVQDPTIGDVYNVGTQPPYSLYRWTGYRWEDQGTISPVMDPITTDDVDTVWNGISLTGTKYLTSSSLNYLVQSKIQSALANKVSVVLGKSLSTNDFTDEQVTQLANCITNITTLQTSKVDAVTGKGLSTNDYTNADKQKLQGIATGATKTVVDSELNNTSTNPVQNQVVYAAINDAIDSVNGSITSLSEQFARPYDNTKVYSQGEYCVHDRGLYKCLINMANSEAWNSVHWETTDILSELENLDIGEGQISTLRASINLISGSIAEEYNSSKSYAAGAVCMHEGQLYIRAGGGTTTGNWNSNAWTATNQWSEIQILKRMLQLYLADEWTSGVDYSKGDLCIRNDTLYKCKANSISSGSTWNVNNWEEVTVDQAINNLKTSLTNQINNQSGKVIVVDFGTVTSLPKTKYITGYENLSNMVCVKATLSNPAAQVGEWTVATNGDANSISLSGSISGSTNVTLYLMNSEVAVVED